MANESTILDLKEQLRNCRAQTKEAEAAKKVVKRDFDRYDALLREAERAAKRGEKPAYDPAKLREQRGRYGDDLGEYNRIIRTARQRQRDLRLAIRDHERLLLEHGVDAHGRPH